MNALFPAVKMKGMTASIPRLGEPTVVTLHFRGLGFPAFSSYALPKEYEQFNLFKPEQRDELREQWHWVSKTW